MITITIVLAVTAVSVFSILNINLTMAQPQLGPYPYPPYHGPLPLTLVPLFPSSFNPYPYLYPGWLSLSHWPQLQQQLPPFPPSNSIGNIPNVIGNNLPLPLPPLPSSSGSGSVGYPLYPPIPGSQPQPGTGTTSGS